MNPRSAIGLPRTSPTPLSSSSRLCPFTATRYHSLAIVPETLPDELTVSAWTETGVIMAIRHRGLPIEAVQFHPESVLTECGHLLLANWLVACGDATAPGRAAGLSPLIAIG